MKLKLFLSFVILVGASRAFAQTATPQMTATPTISATMTKTPTSTKTRTPTPTQTRTPNRTQTAAGYTATPTASPTGGLPPDENSHVTALELTLLQGQGAIVRYANDCIAASYAPHNKDLCRCVLYVERIAAVNHLYFRCPNGIIREIPLTP